MADQKLSELTETTDIDGTSIVYVVMDPTGTPLDRQMTVTNFVTSINELVDHGNLAGLTDDDHTQYVLLDGRGSSQTINGSDSTGNLILQSNPSNNGDIILDNFLTLKAGQKVALGAVSWTGTHTNALAIKNGSASAALTDAVVVYSQVKDGTSCLHIKPEGGAEIICGNGRVESYRFKSTVTTGTAPLEVASTTVVTNLNADKVDGKDAPSGAIVGTTDTQTLTSKTLDATLNTITGLDRTGTLANLPKTGLTDGMIYRPTDGLLNLRWEGTSLYWQTLSEKGVPLFDGLTHLSAPKYRWTLTGSGTAEYACELIGGGNPSLTQPGTVFIDGNEATSGTAGSLAAGRWAWGSYSGFNTVIVRLSDGTDPDTKAYGYIKADPLSWTGGAGTCTAAIVSGIPLMTQSQNGAAQLRARTRAVSGTWTYFVTLHPIHGLTGINGCGLAITDGTKFRACYAITNTTTSRLVLRVANWDNNTTFTADLITDIPLDYIQTHGNVMIAAVDNGANAQFYAGAYNQFMWNVYSVARTTYLTPTRVGPCLMTVDGNARSWFPQQLLQ